MNQMTKTGGGEKSAVAVEAELIRVLGDSLYPGAKVESIRMVLAYCTAAGLDPMMKPVHIVPMNVKKPGSRDYEWRDVIMPGISLYRSAAADSGAYIGKTEPEFGPVVTGKIGGVEVSYPEWCRISVTRLVGGREAVFTAKEYWLENYAAKSKDSTAPNAMWGKRPFAQLAKCAEAQALRMAFPDRLGGQNTAEEMEGKEIDLNAVDITPKGPGEAISKKEAKRAAAAGQLDGFANTGKREAPETIEGEAEEVSEGEEDSLGLMLPEDAAAAWADGGKWMPGWKWLKMQLAELGEVRDRQALVTRYADLIRKVRSYNESYKNAVASTLADAGVVLE